MPCKDWVHQIFAEYQTRINNNLQYRVKILSPVFYIAHIVKVRQKFEFHNREGKLYIDMYALYTIQYPYIYLPMILLRLWYKLRPRTQFYLWCRRGGSLAPVHCCWVESGNRATPAPWWRKRAAASQSHTAWTPRSMWGSARASPRSNFLTPPRRSSGNCHKIVDDILQSVV